MYPPSNVDFMQNEETLMTKARSREGLGGDAPSDEKGEASLKKSVGK